MSRQYPNSRVVGAVLAAGQGTRLRPLSEGVPKPLVHWLDGPMINIAAQTLKDAGCVPVGFNACYAADKLTEWAEASGFDTAVISYENVLLGTGGGVTKLAKHLGVEPDSDCIIVSWNGDVVADPEIRELIDDVRSGATASLLLREKMHDERGIEASTLSRTVCSLPDHDGEHRSPDASSEDVEWFGFTGIMAMRASALCNAPDGVELCSFRDILGPQLAEGAIVRFRYYDGFYSDLGTPERYLWACAAALESDFQSYVSNGTYRSVTREEGTLWIHRSASVPDDVTIRGTVVCGEGTTVAPGLKLEDSVLLNAEVTKSSRSVIAIGERRLSVDVDAAMRSYASTSD